MTDELEPCIGCMANTANITLVRDCQSALDGGEDACVNCYCRPMWCLDCMAKWSVLITSLAMQLSRVRLSQVRVAAGPEQPRAVAGIQVPVSHVPEQVLCPGRETHRVILHLLPVVISSFLPCVLCICDIYNTSMSVGNTNE